MTRTNKRWLEDDEQRALFAERIGAAAQASGMSRRQFLAALGLGGASALLAACGVGTSAPADSTAAPAAAAPTAAPAAAGATGNPLPDEQQVFRFAYNADPASHDFNKDLYNGGEPTLFAGLTVLSPDYEAQPYAAESWSVSPDGTVYTFKINQKGKWTNGDPVTAEDFVYSFTRQLDPKTAASYAAILYDIKGAQEWNAGKGGSADKLGVKAVDKYTLEITLNGPREYFPLLVGYASALPAHRASVEKYGDKWTEPENIVSNGPFKLVKWEHNKALEFERNEDFAIAPKPKLKRAIASIIPYNAGLLPYESGELDYREPQGIPASEIPRLQADPDLSKQLVLVPTPATAFLSPEVNKPPFDQLGVRQALQHAIDRETLLKVIYGLGTPAYSLISQGQPYALDPEKYPDLVDAYKFDPDLAKSKLKGTPYEGGKNWPDVTLTLRPVGPTGKLVGEVLQQQLAQNLGLNVTIDSPEDSKVFISNLFGGKYQFVFYIWYTDYPDPSNHYTAIWYGSAARRRFAWKSDAFDKLVDSAAGEQDRAKRADLYLQAEKALLNDAAYIPLYYPLFTNVFKPYVQGIPHNKSGAPVTDGSVYRGQKLSIYLTDTKG
ncbi:ABC transporter substrate-binding protein [Kouleothrix sp.]|uniref:ABC transporter substrate-binding protein n=1 Tax=Kouleothrix sp. TaxID=2779161 RepID=UPI00391C2553